MQRKTNITKLLLEYANNPLGLLAAFDGYYACPKDATGKRLGPLVGYAGTYPTDNGPLQYVGDVYANFAVTEQYPRVMQHYGEQLAAKLNGAGIVFDCVGAPQFGGFSIGSFTALADGSRLAYIEKKTTAVATKELREQSILLINRHNFYQDEQVVIVEDVLNNFSTTSKTIAVIEAAGATVVAIAGIFNRSPNFDDTYEYEGRHIPIVALARKKTDEWKQDAPEVIADMQAGNVILKPKDHWPVLKEAMAAVQVS